VEPGDFDELDFFRALRARSVRALMIGRRAMIALGVPVLTSDYDLWVHIDDVELLNQAVQDLGLIPNATPAEARTRGRYVLEGDVRVDVLVARSQSTKDGVRLSFDDCWSRKTSQEYADGVSLDVPSIADLITTKKWAMRVKDIADIQLLESLQKEDGE
jgi:hypothetical protein